MSFIVFFPPVIVFLIGMLFRRINLALIIGIFLAAIIATDFSFLNALSLIWYRVSDTVELKLLLSRETFTDANNPLIVAFLLTSGVIIEMMRYSGGAKALVRIVKPFVRSKKSAETSSLVLSHCLVIDDYLSCLTVGSVIRPLTDSFRIPRVKIAFLVNIIAAPLTVLCPISSWAGAIMGFLNENGIGFPLEENMIILAPPSAVYMRTLPYILYSFSVIITLWIVVRRQYSFGLMHTHEVIAEKTGNLVGNKKNIYHEELPEEEKFLRSNHIGDFLVPFMSLLISAFFLLLYWGDSSWFGGTRSFVAAIQNSQTQMVLSLSALCSLCVSLPYYLVMKRFSCREFLMIAYRGAAMMVPAIVVLLLAFTLGGIIRNDLKTGEYLASLIGDTIPPYFMPLIFFWVATLSALALGTAWGTAALLFPLAIPLIPRILDVATPTTPDHLALIFPVFGAVLSGAICGGNFSLLSDIAIMSSTSCDCDHIDHVKAQAGYIVPIFIGTSIGFVAMGILTPISLLASILVPLILSIVVSVGLIKIAMHISHRKSSL